VLRDADDIYGMPVLVADLHRSLPAVAGGIFTAARSRMTALAAAVASNNWRTPAWCT